MNIAEHEQREVSGGHVPHLGAGFKETECRHVAAAPNQPARLCGLD